MYVACELVSGHLYGACEKASSYACGLFEAFKPCVGPLLGLQAISMACETASSHVYDLWMGFRPFVCPVRRHQTMCVACEKASGHICDLLEWVSGHLCGACEKASSHVHGLGQGIKSCMWLGVGCWPFMCALWEGIKPSVGPVRRHQGTCGACEKASSGHVSDLWKGFKPCAWHLWGL